MARRHTAIIAAIILGLVLTVAISISAPGTVNAQTNPWSAQYYTGDILAGGASPINGATTIYSSLSLSFAGIPTDGTGAVSIPGVPADGWSAVYSSSQTFAQAEYTFTLTADDKATLFINSTPVLSVTTPGQTATVNALLGAGTYPVEVYLVDLTGPAFISTSWIQVGGGGGGVPPVGPTATPEPTFTPTRTALPPIPAGALTGTVIRASVLNIRDAPSLGGNRIGRVLRGETYAVVGRDADARWFLLQLGGFQGWAWGYYLFFNFNEFTAPITSGNTVLGLAGQTDTGVRVQSRATLRLRGAPSVGAEQTGRIIWGSFLPVVGRTPDNFWYQVVWRGTVGWAYSPFLNVLAGDLNNVPITYP